MTTGQEYANGVVSARPDLGQEVTGAGQGKARVAPSDVLYRIATLVAVALLLASVL